MLIGKNHKIESDSLNVVLSKKIKRKGKDGKKYDDWQIMGYYATVQSALHAFVDLKIKETKLVDIKTISAEINKLHQMIETLPQWLPQRARGITDKGLEATNAVGQKIKGAGHK